MKAAKSANWVNTRWVIILEKVLLDWWPHALFVIEFLPKKNYTKRQSIMKASDVLIFTTSEKLSDVKLKEIREMLKKKFEGFNIKILVLDGGINLTAVIKREKSCGI
jgi:hypothetical protein